MIKKIFKTSRSSTSRELSGRRGMQTVTIDTGNRFVPKQLPVIHDQRIRTFGRIGKNRMLRINLDITDYMRTKELKEQRDEMEQSCRLYVASQTAAAIAHELNQPLTAISYYADVALHLLKTDKQNPQKLAHILENCALQAR
jgi:C4-dicarboxylate-specific signal transduction histidine kinase